MAQLQNFHEQLQAAPELEISKPRLDRSGAGRKTPVGKVQSSCTYLNGWGQI